MRTIIAGSRNLPLEEVVPHIDAALKDGRPWQISEVVSGMGGNVDMSAAVLSVLHGVPLKEFPADWKTLGKRAGPLRNRQMAEYAEALLLIWDGESRGSRSMRFAAKERGLLIEEVIIDV